MSIVKKMLRLFTAAAKASSSSGRSGPEASARASDLHSSATEAWEAGGSNVVVEDRTGETLADFELFGDFDIEGCQ